MRSAIQVNLVAFAVTVALPLAAVATTEVTLRDRVVMENSVVRLIDVADVTGDDDDEALRLASLPLMPAPAPGGQRFLRKREIEDLLAAHGADLETLEIKGATQVIIGAEDSNILQNNAIDTNNAVPMNRHAAILAGRSENHFLPLDADQAEALRQDVRRVVGEYWRAKSGDAQSQDVLCEVADRHLALLQSARSSPACSGGSAPWTGRQRFVLSFRSDNGGVQFPVYAQLAPKPVAVVIAVETIPRGAVITAAHVELRTMAMARKANERRVPIDSVESLIGMESRQAIPVGTVIHNDQVQSPLLVKRGELITISAQAGGIRVRTTARALQDRSHGELVQVESLETKEKFDARVVGAREAKIVAIALPADPAEQIESARRVPLGTKRVSR